MCQSCDLTLFGISTLIALFPYVLLFVILRPRPVVGRVTVHGGSIRIPISNPQRMAINMLRVEACVLLGNNQTLHVQTDLTDFVILPGKRSPDNERVSKVIGLLPGAMGYQQPNGADWDLVSVVEGFQQGGARIHVRVHGLNAISGLGRAIEYTSQ